MADVLCIFFLEIFVSKQLCRSIGPNATQLKAFVIEYLQNDDRLSLFLIIVNSTFLMQNCHQCHFFTSVLRTERFPCVHWLFGAKLVSSFLISTPVVPLALNMLMTAQLGDVFYWPACVVQNVCYILKYSIYNIFFLNFLVKKILCLKKSISNDILLNWKRCHWGLYLSPNCFHIHCVLRTSQGKTCFKVKQSWEIVFHCLTCLPNAHVRTNFVKFIVDQLHTLIFFTVDFFSFSRYL